MMTRIFWDTIFLISGSLFTLGAGPSNSTVIESPNTSTSSSAATSNSSTTITTIAAAKSNIPPVKGFLFTLRAGLSNSTVTEASISIHTSANAVLNTYKNSPAATTTTAATAMTNIPPVKKFVAAAVRSHFDDCPDSHRHFCFHGTCRFLILEETPACVVCGKTGCHPGCWTGLCLCGWCHPGFIGMRCEHADLLAVVATNHRQQTVATVLVLCVIGCVLIMVMCTLLHCWWRQDCRRRRHAHHHVAQKHGVSCCPSESVV